jgi:hypothetical protein
MPTVVNKTAQLARDGAVRAYGGVAYDAPEEARTAYYSGASPC